MNENAASGIAGTVLTGRAKRAQRNTVVGDEATETRTVSMTIRIASSELSTVRRMLHQALGPRLDVYTAVIDKRRDCASLQVVLHARRVHEAMTLIMSALPEAEFGLFRFSSSSTTASH
ncbi:hypothetical protein [Trinickia diaoshuihuensis]|uniref:hypothetical protein n=1 Tax=Trinickia diaoshuihuensis TaxID=2292265 RepID=UPI001F079762|nr:hypothetical protein [Trinickia diaoshuihuensis]